MHNCYGYPVSQAGLFESEKACADQDIIMAGYAGGLWCGKIDFCQ
ncbi:MAG: hypothetical protein ACLR1V_14285 [Coprococcus sp.]